MEPLLPSEIARLVLGYLMDQKCDAAATSFLEASSHLQECRAVVSNGRRFNTRVNGYTLVDIFDKFFAAQCLVHERLSRVEDSEQVRQCGDLLEQLRFLIDGSRSQRFVVNINVPSQANSQTYIGSPIITSSIRKRHHSGGDRERTKRSQKPLHPPSEKQVEPVSSQLGCVTVEATPLDSLPGHTNLSISRQRSRTVTEDSDHVFCTSTKSGLVDCPLPGDLQSVANPISDQPSSQEGNGKDNSSERSERCSPVSVHRKQKIDGIYMDDEESRNSMKRGKTMATSTDELTTYSSIEVQTTPYALSESESIGLDDEPIENLSLLTKELLNRTELQERIAENINKARLPIEMPSKDESICESIGGEMNTSIMAELNNAIKSIVAATETDPIFENFLDEIIGPNMDTDTSPDEDPDARVAADPPTDFINDKLPNTDVINMDMEEANIVTSNTIHSSVETTEVPLKQRLRSSSRQQNNKVEDEENRPNAAVKDDISLEDHNAAAIMSIINANIVSEKQAIDKVTVNRNNVIGKTPAVIDSTEMSEASSIFSESQAVESAEVVKHDRPSCKSVEVFTAKKSASTKSNPEANDNQQGFITEQEMMAMPTLIVCSREETHNAGTLYSTVKTVPCPETRFIPIAPKGSEVKPVEPIYLRAVHVPIQFSNKAQAPSSSVGVKLIEMKPRSPPKISNTKGKRNHSVAKKSKSLKSAVTGTKSSVNSESSAASNNPTSRTKSESITLYANDNSFGTMIETGNMPMINLDDSMTLTGTGLSPYLKFHEDKNPPQQSDLLCEKPNNEVPNAESSVEPVILARDDSILITRRTPRSLLKSRSKHHRISMSTPRRRSSHIRALDFNTPSKSPTSEHKLSKNNSLHFSSKSSKRARSVCRTSLFKSPLFSNSIIVSPKVKTAERDSQSYNIPIATRSPAPKLMGGWEKYTGVEMILGGISPHPSSSALMFGQEEFESPIKATPCPSVKKSWDADLRQALQEYQQPAYTTLVTTKEMPKRKSKQVKNCSTDLVELVSGSENSDIGCDTSKRLITSQLLETEQAVSQAGCKEIDKVQRGNIPGATSEAQHDMEKLKQVERSLVTENLESDATDGAQTVNPEIQDELALPIIQERSGSDTELQEEVTPEFEDTKKTKEKQVVKKYAKLKTLESKISKSDKGRITRSADPYVVDNSQKKCEYLKVSPEARSQLVHTSCFIDLETPRKAKNSSGIPPTPRVLSPSSIAITPFAKVPTEVSKSSGFVNTPDFPPTPSIVLTPKVTGDNTIDAFNNGEYGTGSPYYQPSTESLDISEKSIAGPKNIKEHTAEALPVTLQVEIDTGSATTSGSDTSDLVTAVSNNIFEITQFEVIKENLPKEEAVKQLKISANPKSVQEISPAIEELGENREPSPIHENSGSSSGNGSSYSTSSDSSSSSSCSTTCSCSSIATTSTPLKLENNFKSESNMNRDSRNDCSSQSLLVTTTHHNLLTEISPISASENCTRQKNDQVFIAMQATSSVVKGESSPVKIIPLIKSVEDVDASAQETPAKNEALLSEANISETPSSSKSGVESLTNLISKISALDSLGDRKGNEGHSQLANKIQHPPLSNSKPKILSVQHVLPNVSVALKPTLVVEPASSTTQHFNNLSMLSSVALDGKLSNQLEEKRLRLMAKLKNESQPKIMSHRTKVKQLNLNVKKNYKDKHDVLKPSTRERKISTSQVARCNSVTNRVDLIQEKKLVDSKNTEIRRNQKPHSNNPGNEKDERAEINSGKPSHGEKKYDESIKIQNAAKRPTSMDRQQTVEVKKKNSIEPSNDNNMRPVDSTKIVADPEADQEIVDSTRATKPISSLSQKCDSTRAKVNPIKVINDEFPKSLQSRGKDAECVAEHVANSVKKSQIVPMSKVDMIKRDLFSDEENSDQRTTRSRTRQLSDVQKNEPVKASESAVQSGAEVYQVTAKKSREELASVLECLKLVPAIKNDVVEKTSSSQKPSVNKFAEYEFVYDDSTQVKKKKIKFSSKDLRYRINVELRDDNYRECSKLMTPTAYGEIFNISPKARKKVIAKKLLMKSLKPSKLEAAESTSNSGKITKSELVKPVPPASSTVKLKPSISKPGKAIPPLQHGTGNLTDKDDSKNPQDMNQVSKKRKPIDFEEDHSEEKKQCLADPQILLKKLNLDLFLNTVHGPL